MTLTIKVLGTGCRNCVTLDRVTRGAVIARALDARVERVEDHPTIATHHDQATNTIEGNDP